MRYRNPKKLEVKVVIVLDVLQGEKLIVFIIFELCYIRKKCVLLLTMQFAERTEW